MSSACMPQGVGWLLKRRWGRLAVGLATGAAVVVGRWVGWAAP